MKNITYGLDPDSGVISRCGSEIACEVIQFDQIGKNGDFRGPMPITLEKMPVLSLCNGQYQRIHWTKQVPIENKNHHRKLWGLKPLKFDPKAHRFNVVSVHYKCHLPGCNSLAAAKRHARRNAAMLDDRFAVYDGRKLVAVYADSKLQPS
jgi:hypothetical protein